MVNLLKQSNLVGKRAIEIAVSLTQLLCEPLEFVLRLLFPPSQASARQCKPTQAG